MTGRLIVATGNPHKLAELVDILVGFDLEARPTDVEESGATFEANALIKARAVAAATGCLVVADDSGLEVDALGGGPGIRSARWVAEGEWVPEVLRRLDGVGPGQRRCRYVCAAAAVWPDGREVVVRGTVEGTVVTAPRGAGGFGYDPIVVPAEGDGRTFAEMSAVEKQAISHRSRAFRALAPHLSGELK